MIYYFFAPPHVMPRVENRRPSQTSEEYAIIGRNVKAFCENFRNITPSAGNDFFCVENNGKVALKNQGALFQRGEYGRSSRAWLARFSGSDHNMRATRFGDAACTHVLRLINSFRNA